MKQKDQIFILKGKWTLIFIFQVLLMVLMTGMAFAQENPNPGPETGWQNITTGKVKSLNNTSDPGMVANYEKYKKWAGSTVGDIYGMIVLPNSDVIVAIKPHGYYRSADQGATWTRMDMLGLSKKDVVNPGAWSAHNFSMWYPDRIGFTLSGGIVAVSSDNGKTWTSIPVFKSYFDMADMDLIDNMPPKTIMGCMHHPDFQGGSGALTTDGGKTWQYAPAPLKDIWHMNLGVVNATTLLRGPAPEIKGILAQKTWEELTGEEKKTTKKPLAVRAAGIFLSSDLGNNWTKVSDYTLNARVPVHYGHNVYWAAKEGVVVSRNGGKTWSVCGSPVENINFGPYFGANEQEMMVVNTLKGYYITRNGGQSWTLAVPFFLPPCASNARYKATTPATNEIGDRYTGTDWYMGWDAKRNILYIAPARGDVWKLVLGPAHVTGVKKENKK